MADRAIGQLNAAERVKSSDLFVLEQDGSAKKLTGQILENWLVSFADGHGGIQSIIKVGTSGLTDTYRITLADTTTFEYEIANGKGITSIAKASTSGLIDTYRISYNDGTSTTFPVSNGRAITAVDKNGTSGLTDTYRIAFNDGTHVDFSVNNGRGISTFAKVGTTGLTDTYKITYNDGTSNTFTVTNGAKGDKGDADHVYIKWSSVANPTAADLSDRPESYIGIYTGLSSSAPTDPAQYIWYRYKGATGDKGDNAIVTSSATRYQASADSTIVPGGTWTSTIPNVPQGQYLWTQTTINFNTGNPIVFYSVARFGIDGTGSVVTVNGVSPDENGNVQLEFGSVSTVNGISPDAGKNIQITANDIQTDDNQSIQTHISELTNRAIPSNPNLLDNPWFTVNQRGKSEYATPNSYCVDRWVAINGCTVYPDGIIASNGIYQRLENINSLVGKQLTMSILTDSGIRYGTAVLKDNENTIFTENMIFSTHFNAFEIYNVNEKIKAVKLEYGAISTLGNDHAPDYATELAKCQRYAIELNSLNSQFPSFGGSYAYDGSRLYTYIPLPVTPRTVGSVIFSGDMYLKSGEEEHLVNSISADQAMSSAIKLAIDTSGLTAGKYYALESRNNAKLFISFDL